MAESQDEAWRAELEVSRAIVTAWSESEGKGIALPILIAKAIAAARAEGVAARDKEWAAAFHRGDWFEDEPDMTLEAFQRHGDNRRGSFNEVARISYAQGVKEGLAGFMTRLRHYSIASIGEAANGAARAALEWAKEYEKEQSRG